MSTDPVTRFPELADFELEMESVDGRTWGVFRIGEDERADAILADDSAVLSMLGGGYRTVVRDGVKTRFRLTPKSWLEKKQKQL